MDKIFIKNLKVNCIIGILPYEREVMQPLIINITIYKDLKPCATKKDLNLSISYADVAKSVKDFVIEAKAELLETLALNLCDFILTKFEANSVTVNLAKPHAVLDCELCGIEISKASV